MPKVNTGTPSSQGRSKVRLLFVEADLANGDFEQFTATLAGAVKPTIHALRPVAPVAGPINGSANGRPARDSGPTEQMELDDLMPKVVDEVVEDEPMAEETDTVRAPARRRKYYTPKTVEINSEGKSFADFAAEAGNPTGPTWRYLIAAYWCAEYAGLQKINADHVYTCYRLANWIFDVKDPASHFRSLASTKYGWGETKDSEFTINQVGRARVQEKIAEAKKK